MYNTQLHYWNGSEGSVLLIYLGAGAPHGGGGGGGGGGGSLAMAPA